jgi:cytochrome c1
MLRRLILAPALAIAAALAFTSAPAAAEEAAEPLPAYHFSFEGPFASYDMGAVQRGFQIYKQVCSNCHSMNHLAYRHLGEEGGPFAAYRSRNHETGEYETTIGPHGHGAQFLNVNDNPYVRSIAAEVMVPDVDHATGEATERAGRPADHFRNPYPNEFAARAANGGALPPDLSVIVLARTGGANYVRSLLLGYTGQEVEGKHYNKYFPGHLISMPHPLSEGVVTYEDGTNATLPQMATDIATFLQWAADPHMEQRKSMGLQVMAFLIILTLLLYAAYRQVWKDTKH